MPAIDARTLHRARRDQIDEVLSFQKLAYGPTSGHGERSRFEWMYMRGAPNEPPEPDPSLWIFEARGKILGQVGVIPAALEVGDDVIRASFIPDLIVLPEYRKLGVGVHLVAATEALADVTMASSVSEELVPSLKRRGWFDVDNIPSYLLPLNPGPLVTPVLAQRSVPAPVHRAAAWALAAAGPLARGAGRAIVALTERLTSALRRTGLSSGPAGPADVGALWERTRLEARIGVPRTAAWAQWRFEGRPGYELVGVFRGARCEGYAAIRDKKFSGHRRFGEARVGTVVDVLAPTVEAQEAVLLAAAAACGRRGCDLVLAGGLVPEREPMAGVPWVPVRSRWLPMFYAKDPEVRRKLAHREHWHFTRGDGDGDAGF